MELLSTGPDKTAFVVGQPLMVMLPENILPLIEPLMAPWASMDPPLADRLSQVPVMELADCTSDISKRKMPNDALEMVPVHLPAIFV